MKSYLHQKEILKDTRKKLVLAWDTGTGKTYGAELLLKHHKARALIIVKKANYTKWTYLEKEGHLVLTKEQFRDKWKELIKDTKLYNAIVIDEAHYFAGLTSGMTKTLKNYMDKTNPEYVWLLTATPHLSTPWNVYTLAVHCGMNPNYIKFRNMFFYQLRMGTRVLWKEKPNMEEPLNLLLSKFTVWVGFDDVARDNNIEYDLSEQTKKEVFFHQPLDQKKAQFLLTQEGIALWTKKHTVQNGFYEDEYFGVTHYEDPKLDHILKTAKKYSKMAVVCRYKVQMKRYREAFENRGYSVYTIDGETPDVEALSNRLDKMEKCIVIIQASVSEGYELPSFPYAVFASMSFSYKDWKQMNGRFLRVNAITPTHIDVLLVIDGIDIDVYKSILNKQNFYLSNLT